VSIPRWPKWCRVEAEPEFLRAARHRPVAPSRSQDPTLPRLAACGFQELAWAYGLRRSSIHATGMITNASLRLLYLIFDRRLTPARSKTGREQQKKDQTTKNPSLAGLTGPAPSGMTARPAKTLLRPARTPDPKVRPAQSETVQRTSAHPDAVDCSRFAPEEAVNACRISSIAEFDRVGAENRVTAPDQRLRS
jgi:hypothetical protein